MSYYFRWCRVLTILVCLFVPTVFAQASPEIMPLSEVQPGMQGIAKTVVAGTQIEDFGVEVLGILKHKGPSGDLILVKTFGDVIDRTGGIAQGMSGSPVYINGKLVGAIAYGWSLTDHTVGMVTPIEDMLKLWQNQENTVNGTANQQLSTPLFAAGLSERALSMLKTKLGPLALEPYTAGEIPTGVVMGPLEPGSAVGAQLIRGDISLGAIGTVTAVDGDKVLAFGHRFLQKGNSNYFLTNAYIFTTIKSLESSFKMGTTGDTLGIINQDRGAGIAGQMNKYPYVIPLHVVVHDKTLNRKQDLYVQIIQDEQLAPVLTQTAVFNAIDKTMDRVGPGTAKVKFSILATDLPGDTLSRENMYFSPASISEILTDEIYEAVALLMNNSFNKVDILDVTVEVEVDDTHRTAKIMQAKCSQQEVRPGDKVTVQVKLKPYRGQDIIQDVEIQIPEDQPAGPVTLEVRGGGMIPLLQMLLKRQGIDEGILKARSIKSKKANFASVVKDFADRDRNNDIVIEAVTMESSLSGDEENISPDNKKSKPLSVSNIKAKDKVNQDLEGSADKDKKLKGHLATDYIIDGDTQVTLNVVK